MAAGERAKDGTDDSGGEQADVPTKSASRAPREAIDELYQVAYAELRRRAASIRRADPFAAISTRTLVHETWLRLAASSTIQFVDQKHLVHIVVNAMRHVLVDNARRRRAAKRQGIMVEADDSISLTSASADQILSIEDALSRLEALDGAQARIVQDHFFGGFTFAEIATDLGVSESTVRRKWKDASLLLRVWLEEPG